MLELFPHDPDALARALAMNPHQRRASAGLTFDLLLRLAA